MASAPTRCSSAWARRSPCNRRSTRRGRVAGSGSWACPPVAELPVRQMFNSNVGVVGGVAPVRAYLPELLGEVLDGRLRPGAVFDLELPLASVADAYRAMDERRAIKVLLRP